VVGHLLMIGIWPLIMGFTMFVQMRLNPAPPDPVQQKVFAWMPLFFTFLLASFPAGLVIYWAWNNTLSVIQQSVIMSRQGVEIPLFDNLGLKKFLAKATPTGAEGDAEAPKAETKTLKRQAKRAKVASAKGEAKSAESETES
jgi:YidC/Oxa1 family membrane protein insertase